MQQTAAHPMSVTKAKEIGVARCLYSGLPAFATASRTPGYVDITFLADPGIGSLFQRGTAASNATWVDAPPTRTA